MVNEEYDKSGKYNPKPEFTNIPPFQRNSVSQSFLDKNPKYIDVFHTCPACSKRSFVNIDRHARKLNGRKCRECGFSLAEGETQKTKSEKIQELKSNISLILAEVENSNNEKEETTKEEYYYTNKILKLVEQYYVLK